MPAGPEAGAHSYPLAPMSPLIRGLTILLLLLPFALLFLVPGGGRWLVPFFAAIYLFVWLYMRPSRFELSGASLDVVWPLRRLSVPITDIEEAELLSGPEFRSRYGWGLRVGAGGLWGGFGLLVTRRRTFRFYISRLDRFVLIRRRSDRPLLITPAGPEDFISQVRTLTGPRREADELSGGENRGELSSSEGEIELTRASRRLDRWGPRPIAVSRSLAWFAALLR